MSLKQPWQTSHQCSTHRSSTVFGKSTLFISLDFAISSDFKMTKVSIWLLTIIAASKIQSTLVISTSVISNNRLSRRTNLVLVITQKS